MLFRSRKQGIFFVLIILPATISLTGCAQKNTVQSNTTAEPTVYKDSAVINFFRRSTGWIASDGGFTIPLSDGSCLWLHGDSHIDDYDAASATVPCLFQVRNAGLLQPANDWNWRHTQTLIGNGPGIKSYLKNNPDDNYFTWPSSGIQLKDTIYIYCTGLKNDIGHGLGFEVTGTDFWAKIKYPEMQVAGYYTLQDFKGIGFGIGFIKDAENKFTYVYGQKMESVENKLYVARFSSANPTEAWQFWNGATWIPDVSQAQPIVKQAFVEGTFQVAKVKDKIVLVSTPISVGCDQGKEIFTSVSDSVTGPFREKKTIYTINDTLQGHYPFFYAAIIHPEFINEKDEILITYAINGYGTCVETCVNNRFNPDYYRLKAIRVPLKMIMPY
jgi:Domain of unknown function (DUF4185)